MTYWWVIKNSLFLLHMTRAEQCNASACGDSRTGIAAARLNTERLQDVTYFFFPFYVIFFILMNVFSFFVLCTNKNIYFQWIPALRIHFYLNFWEIKRVFVWNYMKRLIFKVSFEHILHHRIWITATFWIWSWTGGEMVQIKVAPGFPFSLSYLSGTRCAENDIKRRRVTRHLDVIRGKVAWMKIERR